MSKKYKDKEHEKAQEKEQEKEREKKKQHSKEKEKPKKDPDKGSRKQLEEEPEKDQDKKREKKAEKIEKKSAKDKASSKSKDVKEKKPATTISKDEDEESSDEEEEEERPLKPRETNVHRPLPPHTQMDRAVEIKLNDFSAERWGSEAAMSAYVAVYLERPTKDKFVVPYARIPRGEKLELAPLGNFRVELAALNGEVITLKRPRASIPQTRPILAREVHYTCALSDCEHVIPAIVGSGHDTESGELFLQTEYQELGDVEAQMMAPGGMPTASTKCFTRDLILCYCECKRLHVVNRDIRPSNTATRRNGRFGQIDWGCATFQYSNEPLQSTTGTDNVSAWIIKIVPLLTEDDPSLKGLSAKERRKRLDENAAEREAASRYLPAEIELRAIAWSTLHVLGLADDERNAHIRRYIENGMPEDESLFSEEFLRDLRAVDPEKEEFVRFIMKLFRGDAEAERLAKEFVDNFPQAVEDTHLRHIKEVVIPRTTYTNFILLARERPFLMRNAPEVFGIANALKLSLTRCSQALYTNTFEQIPGYEALSEEKKAFVANLKTMPAWPKTPQQANFVTKLWYTSLIAFCEYVQNFEHVGALAAICESSGYDDQTFILKIMTSRKNLKAVANTAGIKHSFTHTDSFKRMRKFAQAKNAEIDEQEKQEHEERALKIQAAAELEKAALEAAAKKQADKKRKKEAVVESSSSSSDESTPKILLKKAKKSQKRKSKQPKDSESSSSSSSSSSSDD